MKLIYEVDDIKITFELPKHMHIEEVVDFMKRFLLAAGYQPDNVKEYFPDE